MARTLTRRPSRAAEDDYDEPTTDAQDSDEEDKPRRGSRRGAAAEKPARGRRASAPADEDEDGDEDEKPRSRRSAKSDEPEPETATGWGGFEKYKSVGSEFPDNLNVTDEAILIKILDEQPFAAYLQHWIEKAGKKSYTCPEKDCPLCDDLGDKPKPQVMFNVVDFTDPDNPVVRPWTVGNLVGGMLKNFAKDKKTAPINRDDLYWSVSKTGGGKKGKVQYQVMPVKERDVADDWDIEPLTDDDLEKFEADCYDKSLVQYSTRKQLQEVSDEQLD